MFTDMSTPVYTFNCLNVQNMHIYLSMMPIVSTVYLFWQNTKKSGIPACRGGAKSDTMVQTEVTHGFTEPTYYTFCRFRDYTPRTWTG